MSTLEWANDEINRVSHERDKYQSEAHILTRERDYLRAENDRLREALEAMIPMAEGLLWGEQNGVAQAFEKARAALNVDSTKEEA